MGRIVSWFSCGVASAVATKLALLKAKDNPEFVIAYCELKEEHSDNRRFLEDCEEWFGQEIIILGNDDYDRSTVNVYRKEKYLVGVKGARCTIELKKVVRKKFQQADDVLVFGYTIEEKHRLKQFQAQNAEGHSVIAPLIDLNLSKANCLAMIHRVGIELPTMYKLGYRNNNCIGCVKGGAGYWNKIRRDFPDRFDEMARIERELGRTICKVEGREDGERWLERVYLDELSPDQGDYPNEPDISCGVFCLSAEQKLKSLERM